MANHVNTLHIQAREFESDKREFESDFADILSNELPV